MPKMHNDEFNTTSTGAVLGGGIASELETWKQIRTNKLNDGIVSLRADVLDAQADVGVTIPSPESLAELAVAEMTAVADITMAELEAQAHLKQNAKAMQNAFRLKHGIDRPVETSNPIESLLFLAAMASVEGVATATFFNAGGFTAGIGEALGLGLTISGVNVLLSAGLGGFVCGRYWNYGLKSNEADPVLKAKRWFARIGGVLSAFAIIGLLLASGIVRVTGETENLSYTFQNVAAAASDFHSLMLWAIGGSFAVISWIKGLSAFSDPYPGLSDAMRATSDCDVITKALYENALADIADIYADADDEIGDIADDIEDDQQDILDAMRTIAREREQLNSAISQAETDFVAYRAKLINTHQIITGELPTGHDAKAFDGDPLRAQLPEICADTEPNASDFSEVGKRATALLSATQKSAVTTISAAYQQPQQ